jgi:aminoglycoside phosphotransferase (APT) family kinase protein
MPADVTPAAEVDIDSALVRELLAEQHADLAALPLRLVANGWDNAIFRLGDDLAVRLPRREMAATLVIHEQRWLPLVAPTLPLPVPVPVRAGEPSEVLGYPWAWSVCPWLAGGVALHATLADRVDAARTIGGFLAAMHRPAPADAPHNPWRGVPLAHRTDRLHECLARIGDNVDAPAIVAAWEELVATPPWPRSPVWLHGDMHPANVLVDDGGRVCAVIDFGDMTAGDPATDLGIAWMLFGDDDRARAAFRIAAGGDDAVDDDTWQRGRGWALAIGVALVASSADDEAYTRLGHATISAAVRGDRS